MRSIEATADRLLNQYQIATGRTLRLPVDASLVLDVVLGDQLQSPLWEPIPEPANVMVLACLIPEKRRIVLNESRRALLDERPGLLNTTVAHEMGHWLLHVDRSQIGAAQLTGLVSTVDFQVSTPSTGTQQEREAHQFMSRLLMPRDLFVACAQATELTGWPGMYQLRKKVEVTITALRIRLQELGLAYVDDDGKFHRSRTEAQGQLRLL
jgi:hypothetical protein